MTDVRVSQSGDVLEIVLDAPDTGNMVTPEMGETLAATLSAVGADTKLVLLRGAGADFCRGRKSPAIDRATATAMQFRRIIAEPPLQLYGAFRRCPAPILGVVQGAALGVGCALAAACDITIASDSATFAVPEMQHGIPPTLVISALADRVPAKHIAGLVYSRRTIDAHEARLLGIVSDVVGAERLDEAVAALVATMTEATAMALQGVKEFLRDAASLSPEPRHTLAASIIATVQSSQHR